MKKVLLFLTILLIAPLSVSAYEIETDFDSDKCELIISGTQSGHEASVYNYDTNGGFLGMKTSSIENGEYSVKFVLKFDVDTLVNIYSVNEEAENRTEKNDVLVPACNIVHEKVLELFDRENSIVMKDDTVGFEDGDYFELEAFSEEDLNDLIEQFEQNNMEDMAAMVSGIKATVLEKLGDYKQFVSVLNVILRNEFVRDENDNPTDIDYSNYNGGFTLNVFMPKDQYEAIEGLKFAIFDPATLELGDQLDYTYDEEQQMLVFDIDRQAMIIAYIDVDYDFLDETDNQTYDLDIGGDLVLRIDASIDLFKKVLFDGKETDAKVTSGSTVITFSKQFMQAQTVGDHTIEVLFENGSAITNVSIVNNPGTSDNIMTFVKILTISLVGLSLTTFTVLKRRKN